MNYWMYLFLWTLALYGIWEIINKCLKNVLYNKKKDAYMIVTVRNGEKYIEEIIRSTVWNKKEYLNQVLIVDLDSKDDTRNIIKRFVDKDEYIKLVNWDECKKIICGKYN